MMTMLGPRFDSGQFHMAKLKAKAGESLMDSLRRTREEFDKSHKVIRTEWFVLEISPAWEDNGYWGNRSYPAERNMVSDYFKTEAEAEAYMELLEPDKGKTLSVDKRVLREYTTQQWYNF
jgi:hypothetical protein